MCKFVMLMPLILFNLSINQSRAGDLGTAKYAGEFLALGAGGRSLGMGSAFVAVVGDVTAGYWNPAGLSRLEYPQFMLMHSWRFSGVVNYDYGSVGIPVGKNKSLGFSVLRVGVDDIIKTELRDPNQDLSPDNQPIAKELQERFSSADYGLFLTYSKKVSETFSYGGNVKFIFRNIGDNSAWGIGFDIGFLFNPVSKFVIGLNLQDVTSTLVAWDTGKRELITPALRAGVTYPLSVNMLGGKIQPAIDFVFRFENRQQATLLHAGKASVDMNFGWEYKYGNLFALRFGFADLGQPDAQLSLGKFSTGVGINLPKLHIDYAFLGHEELGSTHRISARLTLKEPKFHRRK